jgi:NADPH-dependent stearoyl-CoA 9-desaturase
MRSEALVTLPRSTDVAVGSVPLTDHQLDELANELDAIRARIVAQLGDEDRAYIYRLVEAQRGLEIAGRALMVLALFPPAWVAGVAALSLSKILENMEIGHNVLHGQYDWMGDPALSSTTYEWDILCPADQWRYAHNFMHHTFTNILGKDRDVGYNVLRMTEDQPWQPWFLGNPLYALLLMALFEWGVMLHNLELDGERAGTRTRAQTHGRVRGMVRKARRQLFKDYVLFPALSGPMAGSTLLGNLVANGVRNVWAFNVIFCGHFPQGVRTFAVAEAENESRGQWYVRQMLGSANITGGPLLHLLSGNLSFQIEHHLFPTLPARRYAQIAPEVRALCEKYGLPYNTGPMTRQLRSVFGRILRLALP